ncbi:MAG: DUF3240 family protein [Gammaproteobacteria bacterium]|nr:DUF3240 family protein [Gammaproteobacteria bacterium]MDH4256684.1 DUF3240 family protein [Gammaproteobacteria bacterium]MDH5311997.1 DUF3240 family protein [Gammaproteobacteria bacterium]
MNAPVPRSLVILNTTPSLEELVIDWLLGREGDKGFSSFPVHGHSARHDGLSAAEQVSGRRGRIQFEIHMPADQVADFLQEAAGRFGTADVHCIVLPVAAAGKLAALARPAC